MTKHKNDKIAIKEKVDVSIVDLTLYFFLSLLICDHFTTFFFGRYRHRNGCDPVATPTLRHSAIRAHFRVTFRCTACCGCCAFD